MLPGISEWFGTAEKWRRPWVEESCLYTGESGKVIMYYGEVRMKQMQNISYWVWEIASDFTPHLIKNNLVPWDIGVL